MANPLGGAVIGRYYATESPVHSMDPRMKLVLTLVYTIGAILAMDLVGDALLLIYVAIAIHFSHIPLREVLKSIKPLIFIIVFAGMINLFTTGGGTVYFQWWVITLSSYSLWNALVFTLRITLMLLGASLLTLTTTSLQMSDGIEALLKPLARFGFPSHELAMMTSIAFRFLPTFMDEAIKIKRAQESRGASFDEGSISSRMRMLGALLSPMFSSAFRHADTLSMAMESRCYHGGDGRTKARVLTLGRVDFIACAITVALVIALIFVRSLNIGYPAFLG